MHNVFCVRIFKGVACILQNQKRHFRTERHLLLKKLVQSHSIHKFFDHIPVAAFGKIVKKMDDVRTLKVKKNLRLPLEPFHIRGIPSGCHLFYDDIPFKRRMHSLVYNAHTALGDNSAYLVFSDIRRKFSCRFCHRHS